MNRILIITVLLLCFLFSARAQAFDSWAEVWIKTAQYSTNLERTDFGAVLGRFEGKYGIHGLSLLGRTTIDPYLAYNAVLSADKNYWNNCTYYGIGLRLAPFASYEPRRPGEEWVNNIKIFAEVLKAGYFNDADSAKYNFTYDNRIGMDLWHEWNQAEFVPVYKSADHSRPWGELWTNLSYRDTNFNSDYFRTMIFYFQPKIGLYYKNLGLEPYLKFDLVVSGKSDYWLNNLAWGGGIRYRPWDQGPLCKLKVFAEALSSSYLRDVPTDPTKRVSNDFRVGIEYSYVGWQGQETGNLEGCVFKDANGNGTKDKDEIGLANVKVYLGSEGATTNSSGMYAFKGIKPGNADIKVDISSIGSDYIMTSRSPVTVQIASGKTSKADFGACIKSGIKALVFKDMNENNTSDYEDIPVSGVDILIDNNRYTTDSDGIFQISDMKEGEYGISIDIETLPKEYVPSEPVKQVLRIEEGVIKQFEVPLKLSVISEPAPPQKKIISKKTNSSKKKILKKKVSSKKKISRKIKYKKTYSKKRVSTGRKR